jgi:CBS domain-containing protein
MSIGTFCNREVIVTSKDTSIVEVALLMRQHHVGDVVVVDSSKGESIPVGIITDRDIVVELIAKEVPLDSVTVGDVMSFELATVKEQDGIWDTLQRMRTKGIRRIPVVNEEGGLVGILAVDDLVELLSEEFAILADIVRKEQIQEKTARR